MPNATLQPRQPKRQAQVYLASRSARRRQLLSEYGVEHEAEHPGFDDGALIPTGVPAEHWVASLAYMKASAGLEKARAAGSPTRFVVGADTVCEKDGRIIGTPESDDEAREILRLLRDGSHRVLTGVAVLDRGPAPDEHEVLPPKRTLFVSKARVGVGHLSDAMIDEYVASGQWQGKAGGYNLAERLAQAWPLTHEGDPTTIMGLPMGALVPKLESWGVELVARLDVPEEGRSA